MTVRIGCPSCHASLSMPEKMYGRQVKCPKCQQEVKSIESWRISPELKVEEPPQPLWACPNPSCLHKWPQESS